MGGVFERRRLFTLETTGVVKKISSKMLASFRPTERYLKLLYCGAKERGIDRSYVNMLRIRITKLTKKKAHEIDCDKLETLPTPTKKAEIKAACPWGPGN